MSTQTTQTTKTELCDERKRVREIFHKRFDWLNDKQIVELEIGIYNWTVDFADKCDIIKNWVNERFKNIYMKKAISVTVNLDPSAYINNSTLAPRLKSNELNPREIPFMKADQIFPENWTTILKLKEKKEKTIFEEKPEAMTDQFRCEKCKKRECVYREVQTRSCDEPMTLFIKCIVCGNNWSIG